MELLIYNEFQPKRDAAQFERVCKMLESGNFAQAEVKKLHPTNYFRAKLTDSDRLLFSQDYFFVRLAHCGVKNANNASFISGRYRNTCEIAVNPSNRKTCGKRLTVTGWISGMS